MTGLAASVAGYGVSAFTYEAFSFIQVTLMLFIFIGLGAVVLRFEPHALTKVAPAKQLRGSRQAPSYLEAVLNLGNAQSPARAA